MKKQKLIKGLKFIITIFAFLSFSFVFGDSISQIISSQISNSIGSNNSRISFSNGSDTTYINAGDNSSIIGNYFKGYYYDSALGFFKLDWSADTSKNVFLVLFFY